jgi:hypothetical protein
LHPGQAVGIRDGVDPGVGGLDQVVHILPVGIVCIRRHFTQGRFLWLNLFKHEN